MVKAQKNPFPLVCKLLYFLLKTTQVLTIHGFCSKHLSIGPFDGFQASLPKAQLTVLEDLLQLQGLMSLDIDLPLLGMPEPGSNLRCSE